MCSFSFWTVILWTFFVYSLGEDHIEYAVILSSIVIAIVFSPPLVLLPIPIAIASVLSDAHLHYFSPGGGMKNELVGSRAAKRENFVAYSHENRAREYSVRWKNSNLGAALAALTAFFLFSCPHPVS